MPQGRPASRRLIQRIAAASLVLGPVLGGWFFLRAGLLGRAAGPLEVSDASSKIRAEAWFNAAREPTRDDFEGRPVLLAFFATWCPSCVAGIHDLNALQVEFADKGLLVLGLSEEKPQLIGPFIRVRSARYVIGAGADFGAYAVRELPQYILLGPDGDVLSRGTGGDAFVRARLQLQSLPPGDPSAILSRGSAVRWSFPPEGAIEWNSARLWAVKDEIVGLSADAAEKRLADLFAFYWRNLPRSDFAGDADVRKDAIFALIEPWKQFKGTRASVEIGHECLRRLEAGDPDADNRRHIATCVGRFCEASDETAREAVSHALSSEQHPLVRLNLEKALDSLDPNRVDPIEADSVYASARADYQKASASLQTGILGYPPDLKEYRAFAERVATLGKREPPTVEFVESLAREYSAHGRFISSDCLIRWHVLDIFGNVVGMHRDSLSADALWRIQEKVFNLLKSEEPDWVIRQKIVSTLCTVGHDHLDAASLTARIDEMLGQERVRDVRAWLEYLGMQIEGDGKIAETPLGG